MNMRALVISISISLLTLSCNLAKAGGPALVENGVPRLLENANPIDYVIACSNFQKIGNELPKRRQEIFEAFAIWSNVPTANIQFSDKGTMKLAVNTLRRFDALVVNDNGNNVVALDADGSLFESMLGEGTSQDYIGYAYPVADAKNPRRIKRFYALMNASLGKKHPQIFKNALVHEFGHTMGLGHSQINSELAAQPEYSKFVPRMFPTAVDNSLDPLTLNPDDEAWISRYYPNKQFNQKYGTIHGKLQREGGAPVLGANVIAVKVGMKETSLYYRYSCVSDYLGNKDGTFEIPVLAGEYYLIIEPIRRQFFGDSRVGPYSATCFGQSFINPVKRSERDKTTYKIKGGNMVDIKILVAE